MAEPAQKDRKVCASSKENGSVIGASLYSPVERVHGIGLAFIFQTPKWVAGMYLVDGLLDPMVDQHLV
jgi:hypothetical protein